MPRNKAKKRRKALRVYERFLFVGTWKDCKWSVRLFADGAIVSTPYVRRKGQSETLAFAVERIQAGLRLERLLALCFDESECRLVDRDGDALDFDALAAAIVDGACPPARCRSGMRFFQGYETAQRHVSGDLPNPSDWFFEPYAYEGDNGLFSDGYATFSLARSAAEARMSLAVSL